MSDSNSDNLKNSNFISLHCPTCDNLDCPIVPLNRWYDSDSLIGCVRQISEDDEIEYYHLKEEVLPFLKNNKNKDYVQRMCKNLDKVQNKIYNSPISNKLDSKGKIISPRR